MGWSHSKLRLSRKGIHRRGLIGRNGGIIGGGFIIPNLKFIPLGRLIPWGTSLIRAFSRKGGLFLEFLLN